jgi:hypothetical protein
MRQLQIHPNHRKNSPNQKINAINNPTCGGNLEREEARENKTASYSIFPEN